MKINGITALQTPSHKHSHSRGQNEDKEGTDWF